jgi:hypothetical protein
MRLQLKTLIIVAIGAFFYWTISGYSGKFNDHMSRYYDRNTKFDKNYWTGVAIIVAVLIVVCGIASKF